ncbi:ParB/RepB/Spo0J family partition protein [Burkholderia anthina]|uniref:ParB/RepB/Spo0J family partition protein n=1 Tax=Burkholderia anthina TaxID=179879 RepID=UPI00158EF5B3|nr:ParB/RepB/Spo0J family partition protein [Burkholderia anthina]
MSKKLDNALAASFSTRRDPEKLARDMESTPFAQLAARMPDPSMVPIGQIVRSPFQSRVDMPRDEAPIDEDYIADLAASIEHDSLLNPIIVRELAPGTPIPPERVLPYYGKASPGEPASNGLPYYGQLNLDAPIYELIAGENRVFAHMYLGRDVVSAKVLRIGDIEAARALTVDNLVRKGMTDWELYLHMVMLRRVGAANTQRELAPLLGCSRGKVAMLECYGRLPVRVQEMLGKKPTLIGANQVQMLATKGFLENNPEAVTEAVEKVAEDKISQTGMVGFIERRLRTASESDRREYALTLGRAKVRIVSAGGETRITGDVDAETLLNLLQQNLERLIKPADAE